MFSLRSFFQILTAVTLLAGASAKAQWVVYDLRVNAVPEVSENFSAHSGIYVIAPVHGGRASMIFLTEEGGRYYTVSENSARYFTAAGPVGRLAVISALAQVGTASTMYQCVGQLNSTLSYTIKGQHQGDRVSTDLLGTMLSADDESSQAGPAVDGSIGMVGTAQIAGTLRIDLSRILNQKELNMAQAVAQITSLLEKYGYQSEANAPAEPAATEPVEPAPAAPKPEEESTSIFPPGSLEAMERSLNQPLSK